MFGRFYSFQCTEWQLKKKKAFLVSITIKLGSLYHKVSGTVAIRNKTQTLQQLQQINSAGRYQHAFIYMGKKNPKQTQWLFKSSSEQQNNWEEGQEGTLVQLSKRKQYSVLEKVLQLSCDQEERVWNVFLIFQCEKKKVCSVEKSNAENMTGTLLLRAYQVYMIHTTHQSPQL